MDKALMQRHDRIQPNRTKGTPMLRLLVKFALLLPLAMPAYAQEQEQETPRVVDRLPVLAGLTHIDHHSDRLGRNLQIFIKRSDAARNDPGPLPVVYLLDADQTFPLMSAYTWSLTFSEEMPPSIIVGIGYGSVARGQNFRNTDYTVPSTEREEAGGADTFLEVLEQEIFPLVESQIDADPTRRTLVGQSLGGHFVIHQAITRPGLVALGIAVNPAIHNSPQTFYDAVAALSDGEHAQRLYISSAENDVPRFRDPALGLIERVAAKPGLPWCIKIDQLDDHTHLSSMPRAFRQAMRWSNSEQVDCGVIDQRLLAD